MWMDGIYSLQTAFFPYDEYRGKVVLASAFKENVPV